MSIVAAFLWNKSPRCSISTMIVDDETIDRIASPKINYFHGNYSKFKYSVKKLIQEFFLKIKDAQRIYKKSVIIEFKIVFHAPHVAYITPAKESKFVSRVFKNFCNKLKKECKLLKIKPQLRKKLSGKSLKLFKHELRSLCLVKRQRQSAFEYQLWVVALHATPATYKEKLQRIRTKLQRAMWASIPYDRTD